MAELKSYAVWDAPTRCFHWLNVLCVLGLSALGLVILNAGALGIPNSGKQLLKTWHVWVGYVFAGNLALRLLWAFMGQHHARWRQLLPGGAGYWASVRDYIRSFRQGQARIYLGHNPLGRLAVTALLLLLAVQAITGLLLAGTDLFMPPIGHWIAQWVAAPGVQPASLVPYAPELYDKASYAAMRAWRQPVATLHVYGFYTLAGMIGLHSAAVVVTELRERNGLISAMFTGRKVLRGPPVDAPAAKPEA